MVVRAQSDSERHTAAGVRTAPADRGSSAQPLEWIGLRSGSCASGGRDHHHANRSRHSDDCGRALANSVTADYCRRGGGWSIGECGAEGFLPRCIQLGNVYTDTHDLVLDRRCIGPTFIDGLGIDGFGIDGFGIDGFGNYGLGNCGFGRARCRDVIGVGEYVDDSTWNG